MIYRFVTIGTMTYLLHFQTPFHVTTSFGSILTVIELKCLGPEIKLRDTLFGVNKKTTNNCTCMTHSLREKYKKQNTITPLVQRKNTLFDTSITIFA